jgi:hypothetical protein
LHKIRPRLTSWICPLDAECFRPFKSVVNSCWSTGLCSLLHPPHVRESIHDWQFLYGEERFFVRCGFTLDVEPACWSQLHSRIQSLIPEDVYDEHMSPINYLTTYASRRAIRGLCGRRASSDLASTTANWQRPQRLEGYNRRLQFSRFERPFGLTLRSRSVRAAADEDDFEVI